MVDYCTSYCTVLSVERLAFCAERPTGNRRTTSGEFVLASTNQQALCSFSPSSYCSCLELKGRAGCDIYFTAEPTRQPLQQSMCTFASMANERMMQTYTPSCYNSTAAVSLHSSLSIDRPTCESTTAVRERGTPRGGHASRTAW